MTTGTRLSNSSHGWVSNLLKFLTPALWLMVGGMIGSHAGYNNGFIRGVELIAEVVMMNRTQERQPAAEDRDI